MTMPRRLLLVRHGQSEGNIAEDNPQLAEELREVPNNEYVLTDRGVEQAITTGNWLRDYVETLRAEELRVRIASGETEPIIPNWVGFCSPYVRALQTAGNLGLGLVWKPNPGLCERNWAQYEVTTPEQRARFKALKKRDPLHAKLNSAQSIGELRDSTYNFVTMLHREHAARTVIAVCHGERMFMFRYLLERMTEEQFRKLMNSNHLGDKIRNTQVLEYTRINPETGEEAANLNWVRSFCPWNLREKDLRWKDIHRATFTDAQALDYAERHRRVPS